MRTNLETVQELYRCFRAKDYRTFLTLCADDLEWIQNQGFPGGATRRGAQAVVEGVFRTFDTAWDQWAFDVEQWIDARETVIVVGRYHGRRRETGRTFSSPAAHFYDLDGGKITRFRQFTDTKVIWDAIAP